MHSSRKPWTSSQIQLVSATVFLVIVSMAIYLRGLACHFITYVPTVPQEWIAQQHWKGVINMVVGTVGLSVASGLVWFWDSKFKKWMVILLVTLVLIMVGGILIVIANK